MNSPTQPEQFVPLTSPPQPHKPASRWRFFLPLLLQIGLIAAIPAQAVYTQVTGRTVILQTVPVDPYDLLRGYSQTLRYDISRISDLEQLPGWQKIIQQGYPARGTLLYIILQAPYSSSADASPPQPWQPIAVSLEHPANLPENQIALQGKINNGWIDYGLERYYMSENRRDELNSDIAQTRSRESQPFVVEVKIDQRGQSVPVSLWVSDRNYQF